MQYQYNGRTYSRPAVEPQKDTSLESLDSRFFHCFSAWLEAAREKVKHVEFRVTDARRTLARQQWLFAQGRDPRVGGPRITWTFDSSHRYGLAVDIVMIRRSTGEAIWTGSSYAWLYRAVPIGDYGLEVLTNAQGQPIELVHLQLAGSELMKQNPAGFGLLKS